MGNLKWLEIFKAGSRTSSNGIVRNYTPSELREAARNYNPDHFKAPLVVSYPAHNTGSYSDAELHKSQLAFGFPDKLKVVGDKLLAGFKTISPKVGEWIRNGQILGFSSSFYLPNSPHNPYPGSLSLRHIAGCGVDPPAVKGMELNADLSEEEGISHLSDWANYSESDEEVVEFAQEDEEEIADIELGKKVWQALAKCANRADGTSDFMAMGGVNASIAPIFKDFYQRQRDRLIEDEGVEEAEKVYPSYVLDELSDIGNQPPAMFATYEDLMRLERRIDELWMGQSENEDYQEPEEEDMQTDDENETETDNDWEARFSEMESNQARLQQKLEALEEENDRLTSENKAIAHQREVDRVTSFVERLASSEHRKILPAQKDKEVRFILSLDNGNVADYGEEGEMTPRQAYMHKLEGGKELWSDKELPIGPEQAPSANDFSEQDVGLQARSLVEQKKRDGIVLSFSEAVDMVLAGTNGGNGNGSSSY